MGNSQANCTIGEHVQVIIIPNATICDWIWEKPPLTQKDKYLEIRNSIIQGIISQECMELLARISPWSVIKGISVYELFNE